MHPTGKFHSETKQHPKDKYSSDLVGSFSRLVLDHLV